MTADLRQSIELLPLSTLELADKIQAELIDVIPLRRSF